MKLRKQTPAKALIVAATLALLGAFFGLVRSEPRIKVESVAAADPAPPDYERFFAPRGSVQGPLPSEPRPHTRTRAS
jgi:hypothetical protein